MLLAIGVVGHTSREPQARDLAHQLHAAHTSIDDGTLGCTGNHCHTLQHLAALDTDYTVIVEDDAQPIDDFTHHASAALDHTPAPLVSFYLGTGYPRYWQPGIKRATLKADTLGAAWITSEHLLHAVAYAIPTKLIPDLLAHKQQLPIDDMITEWARTNGHQVAYTYPSLADHQDGPTVITARVERRHPRRAWRTGTRTTWHGPTTTLEY